MEARHLLSLANLSRSDIEELLHVALQLKSDLKARRDRPLLKGRTLALILEKPSNRTRISFEVGMFQLGGKTIYIQPAEIQMGIREPVADVSRVLARYVDGVMFRANKHSVLEEFAQWSSVPVINGLSDLHHPCQILSDLLTIHEKRGTLDGTKICYLGDSNNVSSSLIEAADRFQIPMVICSPWGYEPTEALPSCVTFDLEPSRAVAGSNVIYTDVWTSMGQERERVDRLLKFRRYTVTSDLMAQAAPDAIFMHCLPAYRGQEVDEDVFEGPQSVVFDQAENRLHMQKAVLVYCMAPEELGGI